MRFSHLLAASLLSTSLAVAQPARQVPAGTGKASTERSASGWSSLPPDARRSILAALEKDDPAWTQQAELTASDGGAYDRFGSVAVDGSTVVVGAPCHPSSNQCNPPGPGAVYVFVENDGIWSQQAELTASDGAAYDQFGSSVAISAGTLVVGAPTHTTAGVNQYQGAAYIFVENDGVWAQQTELTASDGAAGDTFGYSVALDGSTAVVGANSHKVGSKGDTGAAYVFAKNGGTWSQQAELTASDGASGDGFGQSVAVSGGTTIVGASGHKVGSNQLQGAAYVFVQSGTMWSQQAELTASDGGSGEGFGVSVAVSSGTAVVGAFNYWVGNYQSGAAYVFVENSGTWGQQAELTASDGKGGDEFGFSVGISGNTVVVGAVYHRVGSNPQQGAAYVFSQSGTSWSQQAELTASDGAAADNFGIFVAISGTTFVVGATDHMVGSNAQQGAAYVFAPTPTYTLAASPSSLTVAEGGQGTSTITITPANGFSGNVSFLASGLPSGVTAVFNPNPAASSTTLTLTASERAALGTATVTVTGTSGSLTQTTALTVTVVSEYGCKGRVCRLP